MKRFDILNKLMLVVLLLGVTSVTVCAQEVVTIDCQAVIYNKYFEKDNPEAHFSTSVWYATFDTYAEAKRPGYVE